MTSSCFARGSEQSLLFHFLCIVYAFTDFCYYCLFSGLSSRNPLVVTQQDLSILSVIHSPTWFSCVTNNVISQIRFKPYDHILNDHILNEHLSTGLNALSSAGMRSRNRWVFETKAGGRRGKRDLATILCIKIIIEIFNIFKNLPVKWCKVTYYI